MRATTRNALLILAVTAAILFATAAPWALYGIWTPFAGTVLAIIEVAFILAVVRLVAR